MVYQIRPMLPTDIDAILRVQADCYPASMQEPEAVLRARLQAAAATCVVACASAPGPDDDQGKGKSKDERGACAYLFAYPSRLARVTDLGAPFDTADPADTLYLHDLAVAPHALGRGLARRLVAHLLEIGRARGLAYSALVSVQDSTAFWNGLGYRAATTDDRGLQTYPAGATYMVRALA